MCLFKRLMILFPWLLPLPFLHPSRVVLWFWINRCFKMFLNSVEIPQVSLTEVTSDPLKLFLMIKLFLYPAEPSPPLILCFLCLGCVSLENIAISICWWKDEMNSMAKGYHSDIGLEKSPWGWKCTFLPSAPGSSEPLPSLCFSSRETTVWAAHTCPGEMEALVNALEASWMWQRSPTVWFPHYTFHLSKP